jgi:single-strand DNA-binding protein
MPSLNRVQIIGNLGRDAEVRYSPDGAAIANMCLATTSQWKDNETRNKQVRTEWHHVVFYGRVAEIVREYTHKGSLVYVEGSLRTRKWQDKDGQDRYTTEIVGSLLTMLDKKGDGATDAGKDATASSDEMPRAMERSAADSKSTKGGKKPSKTAAGADTALEDVPSGLRPALRPQGRAASSHDDEC